MGIIRKAIKFATDDDYRFVICMHKGLLQQMLDKEYVCRMFKAKMGHILNIESPVTFNEKIQWLKLNDRKPIYTTMADKIEAKKYVANILGEEYIIPTIGVWKNPDDIDFNSLPGQFVLKCNHNSGLGMYVCKDKSAMDVEKVISELRKGINQDYYAYGREWAYKDIPRRILAEKYLVDESGIELKDYKFFCFNGRVEYFKIDFDRFIDHRANYYDRDKQLVSLGEVICPPDPKKPLSIPSTIDKMIEYAEVLSQNCPFLRVDFYDVNGSIYFGELTFYPSSGCGPFTDKKWDYKLGNMIKLPIGEQNYV